MVGVNEHVIACVIQQQGYVVSASYTDKRENVKRRVGAANEGYINLSQC